VYILHTLALDVLVDSRTLIKAIEADGWEHVGTSGSHYHFRHPTKPGKVTVPHPKHDLPVGTMRSVYKQAGLSPPKR
jgi:predicted RNA binding protein YcfA (HicA-like mRNA interferase family)